ncbi:MAG: hypothetical protein KBT30_01320 [Clostridiales bacterium]|nr:hypothetical protein [Candidatus Apopatousia equi]
MKTLSQKRLEKQELEKKEIEEQNRITEKNLRLYGTTDVEEIKKICDALVGDRDSKVINYEMEHNKYFAEDVKKNGRYYAWNALSRQSVIKHIATEETITQIVKGHRIDSTLNEEMTRRIEDNVLKDELKTYGYNKSQIEKIMENMQAFRGNYFYESINVSDYVIDKETLEVKLKLPKVRLKELIQRRPSVIQTYGLNVQSYENFDLQM